MLPETCRVTEGRQPRFNAVTARPLQPNTNVTPDFRGSLEQKYAWMRQKQAQRKAQKRTRGNR